MRRAEQRRGRTGNVRAGGAAPPPPGARSPRGSLRAVSGSPRKLILTDIETGESKIVQFNPVEVSVEGDPQYQRLKHPAGSYQRLSFEGRNNDVVSFELVVDALSKSIAGTTFATEFEAFLLSLRHPPDEPDAIATAAPHEVLLTWPGWIAIVCVMTKCKLKARRFATPAVNDQPVPTLVIYDLAFEESRRLSLGAESTRIVGLQRG